jgi:hypothetical protein
LNWTHKYFGFCRKEYQSAPLVFTSNNKNSNLNKGKPGCLINFFTRTFASQKISTESLKRYLTFPSEFTMMHFHWMLLTFLEIVRNSNMRKPLKCVILSLFTHGKTNIQLFNMLNSYKTNTVVKPLQFWETINSKWRLLMIRVLQSIKL